jgi:3',5'-cyclic AMP phosphodiesterase CpdA
MTVIAHLSDLHFGTEDPRLAAVLTAELHAMQPTLVVVSGDLTQRARRAQFAAARDYLQGLPKPQLVVPGNHDVPLYDVGRRFLCPLGRYRSTINPDLNPFFKDSEVAALGINTARSLTWKEGRISTAQAQRIREVFASAELPAFRIVVTHHPFIPPPGDEASGVRLVGGAAGALAAVESSGVDLLLAGHLHQGYTGDTRAYYPAGNRSIIVAQAGTAISRRVRGQPNAYNRIDFSDDFLLIEHHVWDGERFAPLAGTRFRRRGGLWSVEPG